MARFFSSSRLRVERPGWLLTCGKRANQDGFTIGFRHEAGSDVGLH